MFSGFDLVLVCNFGRFRVSLGLAYHNLKTKGYLLVETNYIYDKLKVRNYCIKNIFRKIYMPSMKIILPNAYF